jgi:hypothetical protein
MAFETCNSSAVHSIAVAAMLLVGSFLLKAPRTFLNHRRAVASIAA